MQLARSCAVAWRADRDAIRQHGILMREVGTAGVNAGERASARDRPPLAWFRDQREANTVASPRRERAGRERRCGPSGQKRSRALPASQTLWPVPFKTRCASELCRSRPSPVRTLNVTVEFSAGAGNRQEKVHPHRRAGCVQTAPSRESLAHGDCGAPYERLWTLTDT
jgi:hypothetical protein